MNLEIALLILIVLAGFYTAWSIGANDVANAMGTSVGSGALTLKQALLVAAILEFSGAFFFGSHVSETMQQGIIKPEFFVDRPFQLMLGMLAALIGTGVWLQLASYFGWPVSTTHAIVGSIAGFGVLVGGMDAVQWENIAFIASSWVLSPICGGILGYVIFSCIRKYVFHAAEPLKATTRLMPVLVFLVITQLSLLLLFRGLSNIDLHLDFHWAALLSMLLGLMGAFICKLLLLNVVDSSKSTKAEFDTIERLFSYLQISSACLMAFSHGANDVANAIGPFNAALQILLTGVVPMHTAVPAWVLALGGFGIVVGLATWGWRVIETIGKKITELTPTRGFSAEFGASATILFATRVGMPISTTHTLVGAVIGVAMARGLEALNLGMTRDIMLSWLVTIPASALISVGIYQVLAILL